MHISRFVWSASVGATLVLFIAIMVLTATPSGVQVGLPVPRSVSATLRGGDPEPVCNWFKTEECKEAVRSSDLSTCPAQTFYYRDAQGSEYVKNNGEGYCGTQRTGNPQVYDCTSVMVDVAGCVK